MPGVRAVPQLLLAGKPRAIFLHDIPINHA